MDSKIHEVLDELIKDGRYDPNCRMCVEEYLPKLLEGKEFWEIFAPRHKASDFCKSGKHPHCTCDTCF